MNIRQALHALAAGATAIAGGVVIFAGLSEVATKDVAAAAALVAIILNTYLGSTSTGESAVKKPDLPMA